MRKRTRTFKGKKISRRCFLALSGGTLTLFGFDARGLRIPLAQAQVPGGSLDPISVQKYQTPMLIPPAMPRAGQIALKGKGGKADYYEIAVHQFEQQILPTPLPATTVWGYGPAQRLGNLGVEIYNAPSLTIEAQANKPVMVKWINGLVDDENGTYLPHLLPVDQTLHWANPPGPIDTRPDWGETPGPYTGPVPIVTHVHGAVGVGDESDGYAEAWYLPAATNLDGYATEGTWYDFFANKAADKFGQTWGPGYATFMYPNKNRASTLWYHDHTLGMTRLNVYAGPAGFYLIRGGADDKVFDGRYEADATGRYPRPAILPGPAPKPTEPFPLTNTYYEIPIAIQDRSFNMNGSLFYPDTRVFFDGITDPYIPDGPFSPIWNPEFFGNMMMVNGNTWPYQEVEQRRYRLRFLNGCQSRFLILDFKLLIDAGAKVHVIGNEGGFLEAPVDLATNTYPYENRLLMGLAERADVIVDFTNVPEGNYVLNNMGPDDPFGGGAPGVDFDPADPSSTGQIMQFRVKPATSPDMTTPAEFLILPTITPLPTEDKTRTLALIEEASEGTDADGNAVEGPVEALLGTVAGNPNNAPGVWTKQLWMDEVTENPAVGDTEIWEIYNTTGDAHPMHVHELAFEVVNRQEIFVDEDNEQVQVDNSKPLLPPEPWETGFKDVVIAYPGQVTRIKAQFNTPGQYVWHCHIVEHEDNEMMRPFRIGPTQGGPGEV